jgi:hypothetical protein
MSEMFQHALVTAVALLAIGVLARRIVGLGRSARGPSACASCPWASHAGRQSRR